MAADLSSFVYFGPVLVFLAVFAIMFAVLHKTKLIGENKAAQIFISFVFSTIFVTASSAGEVLLNVIPWFAVLIIALFLIMLIVGFMGKTEAIIGKGIGWVFVVLLIIIFLISGIKVFSHSISPYWPGATYAEVEQGDPNLVGFFAWLYSPRVKGFFLLIGVAAIATWVLVRKWGGDKK